MAAFIGYFFAIPYLFGLAAALDKQGRLAAAAGSVYLLGFGVGPACAGNVIEAFGYRGLGWIAGAVVLIAAMVLVGVARGIRQ